MTDFQQPPGPFGMRSIDEMIAIHGSEKQAMLAQQCYIAELEWRDKTDAEKRTATERAQMSAREQAKQQLAAEVFAGQDKPLSYPGDEFLARQLPETRWAVKDLVIADGNAIIIAARKVGKTTFMLHYIRTRLTETRLLGQFESSPLDGRIGLWDLEMSDSQLQQWLARGNTPDPGRLHIAPMRGYGMPLTDPDHAEWAVTWLIENNITEWIIDPFGRLMSGIGDENSSTDVRRLLDAVTEIKRRAGVRRVLIAVHAGKDHDKGARGSGVIEDWPDTILTLAKDEKTGQRTFRAIGRDVEIAEEDMDYDPHTGGLLLTGPAWMKKREEEQLLTAIRQAGTVGVPAGQFRSLAKVIGCSDAHLEDLRDQLLIKNLITIVERGRQRCTVAVDRPFEQDSFQQPG